MAFEKNVQYDHCFGVKIQKYKVERLVLNRVGVHYKPVSPREQQFFAPIFFRASIRVSTCNSANACGFARTLFSNFKLMFGFAAISYLPLYSVNL